MARLLRIKPILPVVFHMEVQLSILINILFIEYFHPIGSSSVVLPSVMMTQRSHVCRGFVILKRPNIDSVDRARCSLDAIVCIYSFPRLPMHHHS